MTNNNEFFNTEFKECSILKDVDTIYSDHTNYKIGILNNLVMPEKRTIAELSTEEFVLERLSECQNLKALLGITEEDIDRAIKILRRD